MKRKLLLIWMVFTYCLMSASSKNLNDSLLGIWESDGIELTFTESLLMIDEIAIEGEVFSYSVDLSDSTIVAKREPFDDKVEIRIVRISSDALTITYLDDENKQQFTFNRKKKQIPELGYYKDARREDLK